MDRPAKTALLERIAELEYLPDRTPETAFTGGAERAFAELAPDRDGAIHAGHYSGESEWERHERGDEVVLVLAGTTTLVLSRDGGEVRVPLGDHDLNRPEDGGA